MRKYFIFLIFLPLILSCNTRRDKIDLSKIDLEIQIDRFDKRLFSMDLDTLPEGVEELYAQYGDFLDVFSYYIINVGYPGEKAYSENLSAFLTDRLNREVFAVTDSVFGDLEWINIEFTRAFKRYSHYFPEDSIPQLVSFVSRFNNPCFTVSNYIGIGLDMYLGEGSAYYEKMGIPLYRRVNMVPEKIPSDALMTWENTRFLFNDSVDNVLSHIIHEGKKMYLLSKLLPDQPDSLLIGFTKEQLKWCTNNEEQIWIRLVEMKLLFSQDAMDIRKLTGMAPFTYFFSGESPGRAAVWTGWQIIRKYAENNPDLNLRDIMNNNNYQELLAESKYNP